MSELDKLKQYRDEILKAEIGALLFNLGKTHIGFSFWRDYFPQKSSEFKFSSYKEYPENYFYKELNEISNQLKEYFENLEIDLDFLKAKFIELIKGRYSNEDFIQKIFFRGCENINSGIDKGSPNKKLEPPLWLSNAFGSLKDEIKEENFDQRRLNFYSSLKDFLNKNNYFQNPDWKEIRNFILEEIKDWYSYLLSDSRFPINDVTLFDQAYMTASMFKAVLAELILDNSKLETYQDNPSSIKWRILGIQYDKMGLAEKGFKLASIKWYREITEKIDEKIKKLFEVEYPLGNEVYRDETGIYFIVGEAISELPTEIKNRILEIFKSTKLDESREIEGLKGEIKFYIAISKASRGLMNLSTLLENVKENFLNIKWESINYPLDIENERGNAIGICPICQVRLIYEKDKEKRNSPTVCEVCDRRIHHAKVSLWIDNISGETIWTDEIKDKNNRITYISLKFELEDWLSGDLLNSFLGNRNRFFKLLNDIKFSILKEEKLVEKLQELLKSYFQKINISFNSLGDLHGRELSQSLNSNERKNISKIIAIYSNLNNINLYNDFNNYIDNFYVELDNIKNQSYDNLFEYISRFFDFINSSFVKQFKSLLNDEGNGFGKFEENIKFLENYISVSTRINNLVNLVNVEKNKVIKSKILLRQKDREYPEIKDILKQFIPFSISEEIINYFKQYQTLKNFYKEIFFSSITGTKWEDWIKHTSINNKINWEEEKIEWNKFTDENESSLNILATLLLQFLLRKNPSPARLRRIWETTREFFNNIHKNLDELLEIPEWRKKRLVWKVDCSKLEGKKSQELEGNGLLFWMEKIADENLRNLSRKEKQEKLKQSKKAKIYLISSIADFIEKFGKKDLLKKLNRKDEDIDINKDSFNDFKIKLKRFYEDKNKGEGETIITLKKDNLLEIKSYKPYSLITDISPINYQVIIPAEYLPKFIDEVLKRYNKEFKYVYGKLPIHVGIVVSNYKKPVYVNLKALRKIRRDVSDTEKLWINEDTGKFCQLQKEKLGLASSEEKINNTEDYYSLYFNNPNQKDYHFYIKPDKNWKYWLSTFDKFPPNSKVKIIPNTFDFEFMDTNTRRNDIYYDENKHYKRALAIKSNRPYELEIYWEKFKKFKELFKDKVNPVKMHKLVSLFYEKLQNYDEGYKPLLASAIINILELKRNNDAKKIINQIFDLDENSSDFQKELSENLNEDKLKLFIDMFEFWHTALKEV